MRFLSDIGKRSLGVFLVMFASTGFAFSSFYFDNGHSPIEVVIPSAIPAIFEMSPGGNDASLVLRVTTLITNGWFDAIAPYHPSAVGVYSRLGRRPAAEAATNRRKNIAIMYASFHVLNS